MPQKSRKLRQLKAEIKRKKYWIETKNNGRKLNQYKIRELLDQAINTAKDSKKKVLIGIEKHLLPIEKSKKKFRNLMKIHKWSLKEVKVDYGKF